MQFNKSPGTVGKSNLIFQVKITKVVAQALKSPLSLLAEVLEKASSWHIPVLDTIQSMVAGIGSSIRKLTGCHFHSGYHSAICRVKSRLTSKMNNPIMKSRMSHWGDQPGRRSNLISWKGAKQPDRDTHCGIVLCSVWSHLLTLLYHAASLRTPPTSFLSYRI